MSESGLHTLTLDFRETEGKQGRRVQCRACIEEREGKKGLPKEGMKRMKGEEEGRKEVREEDECNANEREDRQGGREGRGRESGREGDERERKGRE